MGTANNKSERKKMCGLWCVSIVLSTYNDYGNCQCMNCSGDKCHVCNVYAEIKALSTEARRRIKCNKCLGR
ncbi:MAG TPA: hypothetical protein IAC63_01570 [Candidatus Enterousia avicola]|uniref:Uncharacterized protein n=1 Tax=Candidatus Enterousia avicola TaxID=2840787 RepID=A0A9D1MS51_9PROT|nr:hypothetical protein [Candidatus Enterousia avicola]